MELDWRVRSVLPPEVLVVGRAASTIGLLNEPVERVGGNIFSNGVSALFNIYLHCVEVCLFKSVSNGWVVLFIVDTAGHFSTAI